MIIYGISDVHNKFNQLVVPKCDLLISTGDYSFLGTENETRNFHRWLEKQPALNIINIMGNHEKGVEKNFNLHKTIATEECSRVHFIEEGLVTIDGLKIWCSAYTPAFCNWAYNVYGDDKLKEHWDRIPEGVDIVATHGPARGMLDEVFAPPSYEEHVGCKELWDAILRVRPKAHLFGHLHYSGGKMKEFNGTKFYNLANCDDRYIIARQPTEIFL